MTTLATMLSIALASCASAFAAPVEFTAEVDRARVSADDSVSLKFTVKAEGNVSVGDPSFNAPEFDVVNEYHGTYVESFYENGRFGMRNTKQITKVLRPGKPGTHRITRIQIEADGQKLSAPDITVEVLPGGAGTPPPRGVGGGGVGLRGAGNKSGQPFFVRSEIDKERVFKGEQLVVSYYLYRRPRIFNIQVDKYPVLDGFLREDLEMPILGNRLETERVVLNGLPYDRTLLARYAAYPLKEGKLKIDSMALKFNYYPMNGAGQGSAGGADDDEDPFAGFFRQMVPRSSQARSEQVTVEVLPLPADGRPASFTGGVGDFNVTATTDKQEVKANEAVTVTVTVEGRGNVAAIGEPKVKWPTDAELYDSKGNSKTGHGGVGEKTFEFVLIPRTPGKLVIPPVEMAFFDPNKKAYASKTTAPIEINVLPGTAAPAGQNPPSIKTASPKAGSDQMPALPADMQAAIGNLPLGKIAIWLCTAALIFFAGWVALGALRRRRAAAEASVDHRARELALEGERLKRTARAAATLPFEQISQAYEGIANQLLDQIGHRYGIAARSMPRAELGPRLVGELGMDPALWSRIAALLEFCETVRFAAGAGVVSEISARNQLGEKQSEAEELARKLK